MDEGLEEILRWLPAQLAAGWRDRARRGELEARERGVAIVFVDLEKCTRRCEALPVREMTTFCKPVSADSSTRSKARVA